MSNPKEELITSLQSKYSKELLISESSDENKVSVTLQTENVIETASVIRDVYGFTYPIACGAVDFPNENVLHLIYYLMNPTSKLILFFKLKLDRKNPQTPSLTKVWEAMSFHERETQEMFGIVFNGHPNPEHLLLSPDWKGGYPLRKDFKGEGIE